MATGYRSPIAVIQEISEDEKGHLKSQDEGSAQERSHRRVKAAHQPKMPMTKANISKERERERERSKRYHRSPIGIIGGTRHPSSRKTKNISAKRESVGKERQSEHEHRSRHRRSHSSRSRDISSSSSSSSSSSEVEEPAQGHRLLLSSARAKLTSPSTISNLTSLTNTTNKSSSSSGSNSTVTQSSITKRPAVEKKPELLEAPRSPAVPDAPNVFAYLDPEGSVAGSRDEEEGSVLDAALARKPGQLTRTITESSLPTRMLQSHVGSSSSASSFHGDDNSSEAAHDEDTDRSTSPERSMDGEEGEYEEEEDERDDLEVEPTPIDDTSAKIASQMAAAQQRQNYHEQMYNFGTPNMQMGFANLPHIPHTPHIPSTALSARPQQKIKQQPLLRAEKVPMTGYELLASRLSSRATPSATERGEKIKPIYRKFEALNHRLLLHLQDELSELEEQLQRLDHNDTQSRRTETHIIPASRRQSEAAGGELQWHKTDILGKIGFKLAQYNQALASFNSTRSLAAANHEDVTSYRTYLQNVRPITECETHFLDPEDDLVTIFSEQSSALSSLSLSYDTSENTPSVAPSSSTALSTSRDSSFSSYAPSISVEPKPTIAPHTADVEKEYTPQPAIQAFAGALAVSILVPILTFPVIPGLLGRIMATSLVVGGVLTVLMQGGMLERSMLLKNEGIMCAGIYGGVMIIVAGLF
ncbi:hypothetical protein HYALB_00005288 [Hymenoscyphus albidus]|uniref:DUF6594 domain-containing protein n=1 Tax=Hymenoscyphus albidus TaxID=595503 RepID=A0A9N9LD72_9HELO|nr:hypothetical protein HYALB_00005288 [Hymenoscyphus albidus]